MDTCENSNFLKKIYIVLLSQGLWAIIVFRLGFFLSSIKIPLRVIPLIIYGLMKKIIEIITGIDIGTSANIGEGFYINHFGNIHINTNSKIGKNCFINNGVTIGETGKYSIPDAPIIGDNCYIGAGAKILGNIKIGNDVIIGANAVVTKSIPDHSTVVGNPGYIINRKC